MNVIIVLIILTSTLSNAVIAPEAGCQITRPCSLSSHIINNIAVYPYATYSLASSIFLSIVDDMSVMSSRIQMRFPRLYLKQPADRPRRAAPAPQPPTRRFGLVVRQMNCHLTPVEMAAGQGNLSLKQLRGDDGGLLSSLPEAITRGDTLASLKQTASSRSDFADCLLRIKQHRSD